jgi:hypothetical protein
MKRSLLFVLSFIIAVFMIGSAAAANKTIVKQITGEIVTVDIAVKTLTVKGKKTEVVITADDKTVVKLDKEKKTLSDVKIGDKVTVKYAVIDGNNVARSIEIKAAKTEKKGADPAKPAKPATKSSY